ASEPPMRRAMEKAVMVANLIDLKRIEHPIRAVAKLRDRGVDVTLTVLGEGPARPKLERLINALDVGDRVELPGYVDDVPDRLKTASFSMLTSASEGLPLSVMEAMGAGCIPIVYDITYGPRDLIEQGKNGYITPRGDIDALADQIEGFLSLNSETVEAMRRSALKTVEPYLPDVGYERWKNVFEALRPSNQTDVPNGELVPPIEAKKLKCESTPGGTRIEVELDRVDPSIAETLEMIVAARSVNTFFVCRSPLVSSRRWGRRTVLSFEVDDKMFSESDEETFNVYLRKPHGLWTSKRRITTPKRYRPEQTGQREWYSTNRRNLSVRPQR